jgi:CHAT domain-containing protein
MPDGRYMCEKYNIRYARSMTIQNIIKNRKYSKERSPMLVMGGAVYDSTTYKQDMIKSEQQLKELNCELQADMARGSPLNNYYQKLGCSTWNNLPGTLAEAGQITKLVPGADMLCGKNLTEENIKKLSRTGMLAKYKTLHIAAHALVVSELPELSAVVLSHAPNSAEDSYLRSSEIADLNINADFVCLSACDTGLGKIYGGEGVVGLTQSFLIAGANSLCVSLWQVSDKSTVIFMTEMYKMVSQDKKSYSRAISDTKQKFINGDFGKEYRAPYYWAPFVFYGQK